MASGVPHQVLPNTSSDENISTSIEGEETCVCWKRKKTSTQFVICLIPMLLLLAATAAMTTLFVLELGKHSSTNNNTPCMTADCITAAGTMALAMDLEANPCDDFYQYACGGFVMKQSVPAGQNKLTQFDFVLSLIQKELRNLLEATPPKDEPATHSKARNFYKSCLNRTMINEKSVTEMKTLVNGMGGLFLTKSQRLPPDWSLDKLLANRNKFSLSSFFSVQVAADDKNVSTNIIQINQGGLGMGPDTRDYYLNAPDVKSGYTTMVETYAKLILGDNLVEAELIQDVVKFEQKLAEIQQSQADMRDVLAIYNKVNVTWLQKNAPFIQWEAFFNTIFNMSNVSIDGDQPVLLYATPYVTKLVDLVKTYLATDDGKRTVQNYVVMLAVTDYGPKLGDAFQAAFNSFQAIFAGRQGTPETWQTCVTDTDEVIGYALGAMYVNAYFGQDAKKRASFVIDEVIASFRKRVADRVWMDDDTKKQALAKLDFLQHEVAFPDWINDNAYLNDMYANLAVTDNYVSNQFSNYLYKTSLLGKNVHTPPDPRRWTMTPSTVNAYYEPTQNKFVVPAGILNPAFFFKAPGVPDPINFGAIGVVTGHEITHGFDDQGALYDKYGNLVNWWSNETMVEFNKRAKCLVDQYNSYPGERFKKYASGDLHLRGQQTLGENMADNGGIRSSFRAFKAAQAAGKLNLPQLVGLPQLTPEQLYFIGFSQVWCSIYTPKALQLQILNNVHSPGMFRVIGPLVNSPDFAEAFNCKPGSNMNPDPDNRCEVW